LWEDDSNEKGGCDNGEIKGGEKVMKEKKW
jgi:hypothetical protein